LGSIVPDYNKQFWFEESHFIIWQQKRLFFLTTKRVGNVSKDQISIVFQTVEQEEKDKKAR